MWELYTTINGTRGEKQEFSDFKEGKKAFRIAVKQAFDENPKVLKYFIAQIDAYCDKYFPVKKRAKKPVPSSFNQLKNVLTNYATNAAYNINPEVFFITNYRDKNIEICWCDLYDIDRTISLYTKITKKKKGKPLMFPDVHIPLRFKDDEFGNSFSITVNLDGSNSSLPNTFSIYVRLEPVDNGEYFDEDDYDEDDDDYDDADYEEDEDVHNEKLAAKSLAERQLRREESARMQPQPQSQSQQRKGLSVFERAELQSARTRYAKAVDEHKRNKNSSSAIHYEAIEKRAFADLMRIEAKYAGRE